MVRPVRSLGEGVDLTDEQPEAAERQPNRYLRSLRQRRGWTLDDVVKELDRLAERSGDGPLGVDTNMLSRWERGVRRPSRRYAKLLCQVYELAPTADHLARICQRVQPAQAAKGNGHAEAENGLGEEIGARLATTRQPELPQYQAMLDLAARLDWERLSAMLRTSPRLDEEELDDLVDLTRKLARDSETEPAWVHLVAVRNHLNVLKGLLAGAKPHGLTGRLRSAAGEAAALAGWLSFLLDDRGAADAFYTYATALAQDAGDPALRSHLLVVRSQLYSKVPRGDQGGDTDVPLALLDEAHAAAGTSSPLLLSWLLAHRGRERAVRGDADGARRDLAQAERALADAGRGGHGLFGYWDDARLATFGGACALWLGQAGKAIGILEEALTRISPGVTAVRSGVLADLGAAYAQQWEVGQACVLLTDALAMAVQGGLAGTVQRIVGVRRHDLARWRHTPAVIEFDEQLRLVAVGGLSGRAQP
jgi:transcriptional regulator with XRE-family HTH domain